LFVALLILFSYEDKRLAIIEQRTIYASLTSGIHESKHAYVQKVDILNTGRKLSYVEKQRNSIPREHLQ